MTINQQTKQGRKDMTSLAWGALPIACMYIVGLIVTNDSLLYAQPPAPTPAESPDNSFDEFPSLLVTPDYIIGPQRIFTRLPDLSEYINSVAIRFFYNDRYLGIFFIFFKLL